MDHDAELDQTVAQRTEAGLLETYVDEVGQDALRLTAKGTAMGRSLAMAGEDVDPEAMLVQLREGEPSE